MTIIMCLCVSFRRMTSSVDDSVVEHRSLFLSAHHILTELTRHLIWPQSIADGESVNFMSCSISTPESNQSQNYLLFISALIHTSPSILRHSDSWANMTPELKTCSSLVRLWEMSLLIYHYITSVQTVERTQLVAMAMPSTGCIRMW